jgi:hypothetical protein
MGADTFDCTARGATAKEAFDAAKKQAKYDYGHRGYTGTIAEKDRFIVIGKAETLKDAYQMADPSQPATDDKWGPAGCIETKDESGKPIFLFFGWASS